MIAFWVLAPIMVICAMGMVMVRSAVHSAILLAGVMVSLAILYAVLDAPFLFAVQIIFALNFIISWWTGAKAGRNPWEDTGLEWDTESPAPHGNFDHPPTVYHGPYEFSSPLVSEDYLMQNRKLPSSSQPASRPAGH